MSTESHRLHLPDQASDVEIFTLVKRALRDADQSAALVITGSFAGEVNDAKIHGEMIDLLVDALVPVFALPSGSIEQRGVALILAADRAILGPETQISSDWGSSPGLASLLHHKFGPVLAKSIVFNASQDLLARLVEHGQAVRSSEPDADVKAIAVNVGNGVGRQLKRAFKAASELPLKESIKFDLWFASSRKVSPP
jgi:enoyl-CoA hydratase/carnithine racemase